MKFNELFSSNKWLNSLFRSKCCLTLGAEVLNVYDLRALSFELIEKIEY